MKKSCMIIIMILFLTVLTACSGSKKEPSSEPAESSEPVTAEESSEPDSVPEPVSEESQEEASEEEPESQEEVSESEEEPVEESEAEPAEEEPASVNTLLFGNYEQDGDIANGAEPIEWIILKEEEDRMLLLSLYALDSMYYNEGGKDTNWEECDLRYYLNGTFYDTAFTEEEKSKILKVTNENPDSNVYFNTDYAIETYTQLEYTEEEIRAKGSLGGNATEDWVFCLSWEEALPYLDSGILRGCTATPYAIGQGAWSGNDETGPATKWWLRSPGGEQYQAFYMNHDGMLRYIAAGSTGNSIRPAIWIGK